MGRYYFMEDIQKLRLQKKGSYIVVEGFKKSVRVELKMAYISLLNQLVDYPLYDLENMPYIEANLEELAKNLHKLTNKEISEEKMLGYITELKQEQLLIQQDQRYYLLSVE